MKGGVYVYKKEWVCLYVCEKVRVRAQFMVRVRLLVRCECLKPSMCASECMAAVLGLPTSGEARTRRCSQTIAHAQATDSF